MSGLTYAERKAALGQQMRAAQSVRLGKSTSNLFRNRSRHSGARLDVTSFQHVLDVNVAQGWVDVEGMTPYDALTDQTLVHGVMPCVVPELRSITVGGAAAGVGIESTSFRYGLVHETILELDVLLADGRVLTCAPDGEHSDLFFGFPNSYGTLGYALRVRARTAPVKPFVKLTHRRFTNPSECFSALERFCDSGIDFLDGVVFGADALYLTVGEFTADAPYVSDYTFDHIYYRSIREREHDFLSTGDYLWRWDTDWFWCSKNLKAQNPIVRRLLGRKRLNSRFFQKVMRWNTRWRVTRRLENLLGVRSESVIQDVDLPLAHAEAFLQFLDRRIGILPIWICPVRRFDPAERFPLFDMSPETTYVNLGFWDVIRNRTSHQAGHYNRLIEAKVSELGGIKSLYSDSYYTREEFTRRYDWEAYEALKRRYDPGRKLPDLYEKCVAEARRAC